MTVSVIVMLHVCHSLLVFLFLQSVKIRDDCICSWLSHHVLTKSSKIIVGVRGGVQVVVEACEIPPLLRFQLRRRTRVTSARDGSRALRLWYEWRGWLDYPGSTTAATTTTTTTTTTTAGETSVCAGRDRGGFPRQGHGTPVSIAVPWQNVDGVVDSISIALTPSTTTPCEESPPGVIPHPTTKCDDRHHSAIPHELAESEGRHEGCSSASANESGGRHEGSSSASANESEGRHEGISSATATSGVGNGVSKPRAKKPRTVP
jgi:hypothetical protein